ncbi:MAG: chorismate mutase [Oscillospiraceae bacterium]|nr:chorismate mutase [Oscillospiraceae bacterium]
MDIREARDLIREADEQMARLFLKRMEAVREVAAYKRERGLPIEDPAQEKKNIEHQITGIGDAELRPYYIRFLQDTMDISKRYQHRLLHGQRIAYSGVDGAFAQIAAKKIFPDGTLLAYPSFEEAYKAAEKGDCDLAVLPIENSRAGEVGQVIDLMLGGSLYVNAVYSLPVTQNLIGLPGVRKEEIRKVISHPQALMQCQEYLRKNGFEVQTAVNTAVAARTVAEKEDRYTAAIASEEAAELYGLSILDHDINEDRSNTTRFAVLSKSESFPAGNGENNAFILLFTVKDEVGGLAKAINVISAYDYNMRVLRSRPMKDHAWQYYFYAEVEGNDQSERGKRMLSALQGACPQVKIAGRYPSEEKIPVQGEKV